MKRAIIALCLILIGSSCVPAQELRGDSTSFDFWVGRWSLTWKDPDSSLARGENTITKVLGGTVVQENFRGLSGANAGFDGMSLSVFNTADTLWHQTWVDNQQSYMDFTGGTLGDKRFFARQTVGPNGKAVFQRMVFFNITREAFDWDWERSLDGKSWTLQWRIHYERKKD